MLPQDHDFPDEEDLEIPDYSHSLSSTACKNEDVCMPVTKETKFQASISLGELLQAGKLVKPKPKEAAVLQLQQFDIKTVNGTTWGTLNLQLRVQSLIRLLFEMHLKGKK